MGRIAMNSRRLTLLATQAFIVLLNLASTFSQQDGFVNINCGSDGFVKDDNFEWISDSPFIKNRSVASASGSNIPFNLPVQYRDMALFTNFKVKKYCYLLPVTRGVLYLVRTEFWWWGGYDHENLASVFDLFVGGVVWKNVNMSQVDRNRPVFHEIILTPKSDNLSLCLARNSETEAEKFVFISSIQLRQLGDFMYGDTDFNIKALSKIGATYYGGAQSFIRYPTDKFDRYWALFPSSSFIILSATDLEWKGISNQPPNKILQTGITQATVKDLDISISLYFDKSVAPTSYYFALYFCDLNRTSRFPNRSFQVIINGKTASDWLKFSFFGAFRNLTKIINLDPADSLEITLRPEYGSDMSPFISAYEIYRVLDIQNMTHPSDVLAIHKIAAEINVPDDWTGDPCLPAGYSSTGIVCSEDNPPRVITINLTDTGLNGSIPSSRSELTALIELMLGNNSLSGSIPDLSSMKNLAKLYLQNNKLEGTIPEGLIKRKMDGSLDLRYEGNEGVPLNNVGAEKKTRKIKSWIIELLVGCSIFVVVVISMTFLWRYKHRSQIQTTDGPILPQPELSSREEEDQNEYHRLAIEYAEQDIEVATKNYSTIIGKGAFGPVYYGKLSGYDVAVKILSTDSNQGQREFQNEVTLLSRIYHRNLVKLIGYCRQPKVALVYEYMHLGTLKDHLYGIAKLEKPLDWRTRLKIASQAAQGLLYLHQGCNPPTIHRDIKSSNILLDQRMCAKLADFGLSKLLDKARSHISTVVKGTPGYLDPEYFGTSLVTEKSDVYSFGVVILEIISGTPPSEGIVETARKLLSCGRLEDLMDPSLSNKYSLQSAWKVAEIAYECVEPQSINRPKMNMVAKELEEAMALEFENNDQSAQSSITSFHIIDTDTPKVR